MEVDSGDASVDFTDLDVRCLGGETVRASRYIISSISKAEIITESLRLDGGTLIVPFGVNAVTGAVRATHSGLTFGFDGLPLELEAIIDISDVFDFLGATDALDAVLVHAMPVYRDSSVKIVSEYAGTMLRHSNPEFWELVFKTIFAKAPFWSAFETVLDCIDFSVPVARSMLGALSEIFPPSALMIAACNRLRPFSTPAAFALLGDPAWGEGCHPSETGDVLDAVISNLVGPCSDDPSTRMLRSVACACRANSFLPIRSTLSGANGSLMTYHQNHKISALVDGCLGKRGPTRRRLTPGLEFVIDEDSVNVFADFGKLVPQSGPHHAVVARISVVIGDHCLGEDWIYTQGDGPRFFFDTTRLEDIVQPSDELCREAGHVPRNVMNALRTDPRGFWIRFDAFFEEDSLVFGTIRDLYFESNV